MSAVAPIDVKGWCPGALRPMESGDGLIVRVRPWSGALSVAQARGVADAAERFGNGHIDLTRRANLQLRGVSAGTLEGLQAALEALGLLDCDADAEAVRNVMVGPLAGDEARALAKALTDAIVSDRRLWALPGKVGWLIDDAAHATILDLPSDVALCWMQDGVAVRKNNRWLGVASRDKAVDAAVSLALGGTPALAALDIVPVVGSRPLGIAAPFGRLEAPQLRQLMGLAVAAGAHDVRLSPWRALHFDVPVEGAVALGLIVDADDPLLRIEACPGAPACRSSTVDTRGIARRLASRPFAGTVHVSGCAKGCARSRSADLVLVGTDGRFGVVHNGTSRSPIERIVTPDTL
jgi:precorrin-3B synthase